ncbi:MAG: NAD(P)-dependent dehydrogenase (short-subunit alcohol dehydrogenase family) [Gammaproteobacteria bacterium]
MRSLVTGAASGIGRATCVRLARDANDTGGAMIAPIDLQRSSAMDELVEELQSLGARVEPGYFDMATTNGPAEAVLQTVAAFGGLDGLVSNAGINRPGALIDYTVEDWDALFAVNTRASWLLAKAAHANLSESGGAMVITASMSGSNAHAGLGAYGPSKAAAIMLAKVLAQEFAPDGIRVNSVSPGFVHTGMTTQVYADEAVAKARAELVPVKRVAQPEDLADAIAYLLSDAARYVNGHDLVVDGGLVGNLLGRTPGLTAITRS